MNIYEQFLNIIENSNFMLDFRVRVKFRVRDWGIKVRVSGVRLHNERVGFILEISLIFMS